MTPQDSLRSLRAIFMEGRWIKGAYTRPLADGRTGYCMIGGLGVVANGRHWNKLTYALHKAIGAGVTRHGSIAGFNDHPSTKQRDVIAAIDGAIGILDEQDAAKVKAQ